VGSGWTLIGGNPAPGDVGVLETASGSVYQVREEANDFVRQVRGILAGWAGSGWSGPAASKFEEFLQAAGQHLSQMESAHEPVGNALTAHATALAEQQPIATRALQAAERAQARRDTASDRQASARAQYARAEQSHTQATSELSRIESAITTRVQELEAVGTQILGDLLHVADPDLQSLFGEQREWTGAQNVARDVMEGAARVIGDMEGLISDAEAALSAAIRLANDVRSEVERSASHARSLISDVDNDLSDVWHHVGQDLGLHADDPIHIAEELLIGLGVASGLLTSTAGPTGAAVIALAPSARPAPPSIPVPIGRPPVTPSPPAEEQVQGNFPVTNSTIATVASRTPNGTKMGQCYTAVVRWLHEAGIRETMGGTGPIQALEAAKGVPINSLAQVQRGDVVQLIVPSAIPDGDPTKVTWTAMIPGTKKAAIHTVIITKVEHMSNGVLKLTYEQSNAAGNELSSKATVTVPPGFEIYTQPATPFVFRFGKVPN